MPRYNTIRYDTIRYDTIRYNTIRYDTIRYNTIQYNTIQYNTIQYNTKYKLFVVNSHRDKLQITFTKQEWFLVYKVKVEVGKHTSNDIFWKEQN